jgi:hypothetical protein
MARGARADTRAYCFTTYRFGRAIDMGISILATVLGLFLLAMPAWGGEVMQQPPLPPGTRITMQNWQKYQSYMPRGIIEMWKGTHPWKLPPDAVMEVGPTVEYPNPKWWYDATEKYKGQTRLVKNAAGGYGVQGYVTGIPFSPTEFDEPGDGAYKLLYDEYYYYHPALNHYASDGDEVDRYLNVTTSYSIQVGTLLGHGSDPGFPPYSDVMKGYFYAYYDELESPEQSKYTAPLELVYDDPDKLPESYVFLPSLRRALRLSSGARCAPYAGSDYVGDDVLNGIPNPVGWFSVTRLPDRKMLVFRQEPGNMAQYDQKNFYWPPLPFPKPSLGKWMVRDAYVVDIKRLPQYASGYCYGIRRNYVDKANYNLLYGDLFDSSDKFWKSLAFLESAEKVPHSDGYLLDVRGNNWMIDMQGEHLSWAITGKDVFQIDDEVPEGFRDQKRYASPAGLADVMK